MNQHVLALNLVYIEITKFYIIERASRHSGFYILNQGRSFISKPFFSVSLNRVHTSGKYKRCVIQLEISCENEKFVQHYAGTWSRF